MPLKVAFIGAGSIGFTRRLFRDMLSVPELQDTEFAFHDIVERNAEMVNQICQKDLDANKLPAKITTTLDRKRAVADADYIINCTRIGGLEAFATDIEIPLKYGIDQCVGDTLCAGGIMYGQRNIPQYQASGQIAAAKKRLAKCDRVKTSDWKGSARLKVKSVAEIRKLKGSDVLAAENAAVQRSVDARKGRKTTKTA